MIGGLNLVRFAGCVELAWCWLLNFDDTVIGNFLYLIMVQAAPIGLLAPIGVHKLIGR